MISVKEAAARALIVHGGQDFGKGIAQRLIKALPKVSEPQDRIRNFLVLKKTRL